MKKRFKTLLACLPLVLAGCSSEPMPSQEVVVTVTGECACEITFYGSMGGGYQIDYDCRDGKYYPIYLKEDTYRVVAEEGNDKVELVFVKGKYAQQLGIDF